jgi:tetratricopeptide (TPR) repeat protein
LTDKKGLPVEIPVPEKASAGAGDEQIQVSEDQLKGLMDGRLTFQKFFDLSDDVLLAWANQGYFFYNQGKYHEAETIFAGLVTLNPQIAYYHTALGSIYEAQEKYDKALQEFEKALNIDKNDICAIVNRGEILLREGKVVEAAEEFKRAIDLDNENIGKLKAKGEKNPANDPAAQRARTLSLVTYEVLKEIEAKVKEAQAKENAPQ